MNENEYDTEKDRSAKKELSLVLISSFTVFLTGLLMMLCSAFLFGKEKEPYTLETVSESTAATESSKEADELFSDTVQYYVIREDEDGYISVYLSGGELYRRLDIPAYTLPLSDRARLEIGIMVQTDAELASYIEGFSG